MNTGMRHPEELSFCKPLDPNHLKFNLKDLPGSKKRHSDPRGGPNNGLPPPDTNTFIANSSPSGSTGSLDKSSPPFMCAPVTPTRHHTSTPISSPVNTVSPAFILDVHRICSNKIVIIIHEYTKCSLKRYSIHCLKVDRLSKFCIRVGAVKHEYFILLLEVDWTFGLLRWCISPHGWQFVLMLWDLPVTQLQETRCFSVAGRFHFMQVFEVKSKKLGMVKYGILFYPSSV